jgi:predicted cupin superfamily sugar epimerase
MALASGGLPPAAGELVRRLGLAPIYEGVYLKKVCEGPSEDGRRPAFTHSLALAAYGAPSLFHRLDCDEIWQFSAGQALSVYICGADAVTRRVLGLDAGRGEEPALFLPRGVIFGALPAEPAGWCLFGCTCLPGFLPENCEFIRAGDKRLAGFAGQENILRKLTDYPYEYR